MKRIAIDAYVFEALMRDLVGHDRRPAAFLVYLTLWAASDRRVRRRVGISLARLAEDTGLSKSAVQAGLRVLVRRRLVRLERAHRTAVPEYEILRPWAASRHGRTQARA